MRTVIVLGTAARWTRLAELLAGRGKVVVVAGSPRRPCAAVDGMTVIAPPGEPGGWSRILDGADAVVHLGSPEGIGSIARALASQPRRPSVLIATSSVAYYGAGASVTPLTERSPAGAEGAAQAVRIEEEATTPAREAGIRVCIARVGSSIDAEARLLEYLVPLYKCRAGLKSTTDDCFLSWCHAYDLARAFEFAIDSSAIDGPFNAVAPAPATIEQLDQAMTEALDRRPAIRMPLSAATLLLGDGFRLELALGPAVVPNVLMEAGFAFVYPDLRSAMLDAMAC